MIVSTSARHCSTLTMCTTGLVDVAVGRVRDPDWTEHAITCAADNGAESQSGRRPY